VRKGRKEGKEEGREEGSKGKIAPNFEASKLHRCQGYF
jgi:predicted transposase YdaD